MATATSSGRLVGRDAELEQLHQFLDAKPLSARTLVLAGGPGYGKTSLWEAGVGWSRQQDADVLVARPSEPETQLSFAALGDLLEHVNDAVLAALPSPQRHALEVALLRSEPSERPPEARAIAAGFLGVLRELAGHAPVVVAVDDVQWLDAASATVLQFAQRRLDDEPIAFLLTERTGERLGRFAVEESQRTRRMEVGGLSMGAARLLLAERLDFHPPRALVRRIFESTYGNPLYTLELARNLRDTDHRSNGEQPIAVPRELGVLLGQRLTPLSDSAKTAALAASLASEPSTGLIATLRGPDAVDSLAELIDADVVTVDGDRIRFAHPLLASTVTTAATIDERRAMEQQLARAIGDPVTSARHLARANDEPDALVATTLEEAAALARARGGWDTAAELLERARDLTPLENVEERQRRGLVAAEYHAHSGDRLTARVMVEALLTEELSRANRANALRVLAEISADDENFAGAVAVYEEALQYVDDPLLEVAIEVGLSYVCATSWNPAGGAHAHRSLEIAERCSDEGLMSGPLAVCAMVDFMFGGGADWTKIERSLALEDHDVLVPLQARPSTIAALLQLYTGNHADARDGLTAIWARANDQGDESDLAFVLNWLSWLETRSGNLTTAASLADQAQTFAELTGSKSMRALAMAQRAFVGAHQGESTLAREASAQAADIGAQVDFFLPRVWMSATLALLELSLGNPEGAWNACEEMTVPIEALGIAEPILPFFLPDAIESLVALEQLDRAEALIAQLEQRGRELDRPWALALGARSRAHLLAARGELAESLAAMSQALTEHERLDMPFERARTLLAKGTIERRNRQRANARDSLTEALEAFEHIGAPLWCERARAELARVSGRRSRNATELTPTEQRVVQLAVDGHSNKEIAETLFVSVNTVETHLSRAYSKLGVRSRSQLPRDLGTRG